jgi:hypothetical protein
VPLGDSIIATDKVMGVDWLVHGEVGERQPASQRTLLRSIEVGWITNHLRLIWIGIFGLVP